MSEDQQESRFVHLLQPNNRDLAANWAVDVARELENYLLQLSETGILENGSSSLNFAEAALLIQGSTQIYSRKVEYLYTLVLQTLEFIAQKKQDQQEKKSVEENGESAGNIFEEEGEEGFLNVDDVKEEANIDIDEEGYEASATFSVKRPPASLLVLEGEATEIGGDAGELGVYQISTCSLHRDFLLLDPCDADAVDDFLNSMTSNANGNRDCPPALTPCRTPRTPKSGGGTTPGKRPPSTQKYEFSKELETGTRNLEFDDAACNQDAFAHESSNIASACHTVSEIDFDGIENDFCTSQEGMQTPDASAGHEGKEDPWQFLNPHELGNLMVKPYRQGMHKKKWKDRNALRSSSNHEFPLAQRVGTVSHIFDNAFEAIGKIDDIKESMQSPPLYEKLRSSMVGNEASDDGSGASIESDPEDPLFDDDLDPVTDSYPLSENFDQLAEGSSGVNASFKHDQAYNENCLSTDDGESFEQLCRAHMDSLLRSIADSAKQTELTSRVSSWKQKIESNLQKQDSNPPFDIHVYGERVLDKLSTLDWQNNSAIQMSFVDVVSGQERHEIARTFAALLQLVNNGNVAILKGDKASGAFCFTSEEPFFVKLLSSNRRHEEMLQYKAPSMLTSTTKKASKNKNKLSPRHKAGIDVAKNTIPRNGLGKQDSYAISTSNIGDIGKVRLRSASRVDLDNGDSYSIDSGRATPRSTPRFTPETKRRRRLHSVSPLQMELAR